MRGDLGRIGFVILALLFAGAALLTDPDAASASSYVESRPARTVPSPQQTAEAIEPRAISLSGDLPAHVLISMSDEQLSAWHSAQRDQSSFFMMKR